MCDGKQVGGGGSVWGAPGSCWINALLVYVICSVVLMGMHGLSIFCGLQQCTRHPQHFTNCRPHPSPFPSPALSGAVQAVLYKQFKFFLILYFLMMALTQAISQFRINQWYPYWGPS